jgi:hypothetical protein
VVRGGGPLRLGQGWAGRLASGLENRSRGLRLTWAELRRGRGWGGGRGRNEARSEGTREEEVRVWGARIEEQVDVNAMEWLQGGCSD